MNPRMMVGAAVLAAALTGCAPAPGEVTVSPSAAPASTADTQASPPASLEPSDSVPSSPLGVAYELTGSSVADWGEPLGSLTGAAEPGNVLSREGWRADLMGVYRLGTDRVLVEVRLNADHATGYDNLALWTASDFGAWFHLQDRRNGGFDGYFSEFSSVTLRVAGDENTYLPVRTKTNHCLCTTSTNSFRGKGDFPAFVVMTAPAATQTVSLSLPGFGEFKDVPVSAALPDRTVTPLLGGYQLRVGETTSVAPGRARVRFSLERPAEHADLRDYIIAELRGRAPWDNLIPSYFEFNELVALSATGATGGWPVMEKGVCPSCTRLSQGPQVGQAVDAVIDLPDPGGDALWLVPLGGWPVKVGAVQGTRAKAAAGVVEYRAQYAAPATTVAGGDEVALDTAVLFATDSAKLTAKAGPILRKVVTILEQQDGRTISVVGHADSTGNPRHNLELSKRRAQAVRDVLATQLGTGWTLTVEGRGETDPRVKESGLSGKELARARALNRRVEVTAK